MKSSPFLLAFYKAWIGETKHPNWQRYNGGLCMNLYEFACAMYPNQRIAGGYLDEMREQFLDAGLNPEVPFNDHLHGYREELYNHACHTNKLRIQWVKNRIKDMEETE